MLTRRWRYAVRSRCRQQEAGSKSWVVAASSGYCQKHLLRRPRRLRTVQKVEAELRPRLELAGQAPQRVVREGHLGVHVVRRVREDHRPLLRTGSPVAWQQWPVSAVEDDVHVRLVRVAREHLQYGPCRRLVATVDASRRGLPQPAADNLEAGAGVGRDGKVGLIRALQRNRAPQPVPARQVLSDQRRGERVRAHRAG